MGSSVGISFTVRGPLLKALDNQIYVNPRLREKLNDFSPWFVKERGRMQANFMSVWAEGQHAWPAISETYRKWKIKKGFSARIMQMRNWTLHAMLQGQLDVVTKTQWVWGIDRSNSMWYQGRSSMPYPETAAQTRPFAIILDQTWKAMEKDLRKYINKLFGKQ